MKNKIIFLFSILIPISILIFSCKSEQNGTRTKKRESSKVIRPAGRFYSIVSPESNEYASPGNPLSIILKTNTDTIIADSIKILFEGEVIKQQQLKYTDVEIMVPETDPGISSVRILLALENGKTETHTLNLRITSDIIPDNYRYRVKKTYPHDKGAYTQGLEYENGFLYEGTGNYGESSLRKVELSSGEILKYRNLSSDLFGEGITHINNRIYQITYHAQVGFVYDEDNFELLRKIYYQIREGWGLTNNGEHILMSDGSNTIYYMDTTYFSVVKQIEVYDNEKEISLLNELELINGILYANRYTTNEIVMIDPETGKLLGRIDMTGILADADRHPSIDYFNGIAYDQGNNRIFVTGKYWPKLYEVEFVKVP